jgi:hypothetical protein
MIESEESRADTVIEKRALATIADGAETSK